MIEFHLDSRSGVAPYMQLIHQVRHALRLGLLDQGDQLPTVKDVAAGLAINPNTVLKAYRELEYQGLVGRPARARDVRHRDAERDVPGRARAAAPGTKALAGQGAPGRDGRGEHRGSLPEHLSVRFRGGHSMTALNASGLGKRYRQRWALSDCTLQIPEGRVPALVGPNGAGKTTLLHLAVGLLAPSAGTITVLDGEPAGGPAPAGQGRLRRAGHPGVRAA